MHGPTCIFWANLTPFSLKALEQAELAASVERINRAQIAASARAAADRERHARSEAIQSARVAAEFKAAQVRDENNAAVYLQMHQNA